MGKGQMRLKICPVTRENYESFITEREFAVIHFDAEWDFGHRPHTRLLMTATAKLFPANVNFGEVDCDAESELAKSIPVCNVPLLAYFRRGQLVGALVGSYQNIAERLRRIMRHELIGYNDGSDSAPRIEIDEKELRRDWKQARDESN
jgi:thioredoxin-like negative regulator of GroEL